MNPQYREFERFSTTVVNAYVGPAVGRYLSKLRDGDIGKLENRSIYIMGSAGGVMDIDTAEDFPVRTIFSGPAGGVTAGDISPELGVSNFITCDMGERARTSPSSSGPDSLRRETVISGYPSAPPARDETVGAGAGSIVWVGRRRGALRDQSAALAGSRLLRFGGAEPTVTDRTSS